jgi:hypothetical protein
MERKLLTGQELERRKSYLSTIGADTGNPRNLKEGPRKPNYKLVTLAHAPNEWYCILTDHTVFSCDQMNSSYLSSFFISK